METPTSEPEPVVPAAAAPQTAAADAAPSTTLPSSSLTRLSSVPELELAEPRPPVFPATEVQKKYSLSTLFLFMTAFAVGMAAGRAGAMALLDEAGPGTSWPAVLLSGPVTSTAIVAGAGAKSGAVTFYLLVFGTGLLYGVYAWVLTVARKQRKVAIIAILLWHFSYAGMNGFGF